MSVAEGPQPIKSAWANTEKVFYEELRLWRRRSRRLGRFLRFGRAVAFSGRMFLRVPRLLQLGELRLHAIQFLLLVADLLLLRVQLRFPIFIVLEPWLGIVRIRIQRETSLQQVQLFLDLQNSFFRSRDRRTLTGGHGWIFLSGGSCSIG